METRIGRGARAVSWNSGYEAGVQFIGHPTEHRSSMWITPRAVGQKEVDDAARQSCDELFRGNFDSALEDQYIAGFVAGTEDAVDVHVKGLMDLDDHGANMGA